MQNISQKSADKQTASGKNPPDPPLEPAYSDAGYVSSDRAGAVPPRYRVAERMEKQNILPRVKNPEKRTLGASAIVCLCLACSLVGGLFGGAAVRFSASSAVGEHETSPNDAVLQVAASPIPSVTTTLVAPGGTLSGSEIYERGCLQTVNISVGSLSAPLMWYAPIPTDYGAGFVISANGYIMTSYQVVSSAALYDHEIAVSFYDGSEYVADLIGYDTNSSLAILKIDAESLDFVTFANSDGIKVGEEAYTIDSEFVFSSGRISALNRDILTGFSGFSTSMFQFDASINRQNLGGPVYNSRGEIIGIVSSGNSRAEADSAGFALPINDARAIAEELITRGYVSGRAELGIDAGPLSPVVAQYYGMPLGIYVVAVYEGSAADRANLLPGDLIISIDGADVSTESAFRAQLKNFRGGDTAKLQIFRNGEYQDLDITFDEHIPSEFSGADTAPQAAHFIWQSASAFGEDFRD